MAIKEGRCPNCGSIINLDPTAEKGHCLFCDAVFENQKAFIIAANSKDVVFPNAPQPKYEGPNLDAKPLMGSGSMSTRSKQSQQTAAKARPAAVPAANVQKAAEIKMPEIKMSMKSKIRILIVTVVILAIIAAISVPIVTKRNSNRVLLSAAMSEIAPFSINVEKDVAISETSNSYLLIASSAAISERQMITLFKNYCEKRANIQKIDLADFNKAYGQVTVKLVTPEGGFLIANPKDMATLESGAATTKLS